MLNSTVGPWASSTVAGATTPVITGLVTTGGALGSATPMMNGVGAAGSSTVGSRQDHVHPVDTSRAAAGQTFFLGTTSIAINRGSSSITLTGINSIDGYAGGLAGGTLGAMPYQSASNATAFLAGNSSATPKFIASIGTGSAAQAPTLVSSYGSGNVALETDGTWTPTVSGLTVVGTPTYTAKFRQVGNIVFFSLQVQSTTTTAATSGSTTFSLPSSAAMPSTCSAANVATGVSYGTGVLGVATLFVPTWPAVANVVITGFYFVA